VVAPQIVAADPLQGGAFYSRARKRLFEHDGGATWTRLATIPGVQYTIQVTLAPNPAKRANLWIAHKPNANHQRHSL